MFDHSLMLSAICGPDGAPLGWALLSALFVAGLVGSVAHCAPMCGPFVLAQVSQNWGKLEISALCPRQRLRQGVLLPYHAGRLLTYSGLGAVAAMSGEILQAVPGLGWIPSALLVLGAALMLGQALKRLGIRMPFLSPNLGLARLANRVDRSTVSGGFLFGVVLGFLPCGFLYAALAVAASSGDPLTGAGAMLAFGLGTMPSLIGIGVAGQAFGRGWARFGPVLLMFNAAVLLAMALVRLDF
jgi:sulfite exporter TauE/SafE